MRAKVLRTVDRTLLTLLLRSIAPRSWMIPTALFLLLAFEIERPLFQLFCQSF